MENRPSPEELCLWFEWAGEKLLSLKVARVKPQEPRALWPEFKQDPFTAYGYTEEQLRPSTPGAKEIQLMDQILELLNLEPQTLNRRILSVRLLVRPLNGRYLYSWSRIAQLVKLDRRGVKFRHQKALENIAQQIRPELARQIRQQLEN